MKKLFVWCLGMLAWCATGANAQTVAPDNTGMTLDALDWTKEVKMGWNLGNSLESGGNETAWGNPKTTKEMIHAVSEAGFNGIRIPVRWGDHLTDATKMTIDPAWIARVQEVVDWALAEDMFVIINAHHEEWLEQNPSNANKTERNDKLKALWINIATYFRDYDQHLVFAGTNEVRRSDWGEPTTEQQAVQNSFNQTFVDAVRATGGKNYYRNLIVQTFACSSYHGFKGFTVPTDKVENRLSVEVHYYDPYGYGLLTGNAANDYYYWGEAYKDKGRVPSDNETTQANLFDRLRNTWAKQGLGIVIGECGVTNHYQEADKVTQQENMQYYLKTLFGNARERGFAAFVWDNNVFTNGNESFGIFRRNQGMAVGTPYFLKGISEGAGVDYKEPEVIEADEGGVAIWEGDELLDWGNGLQLTVSANNFAGQSNRLQMVLSYKLEFDDYDDIQIFEGDWSQTLTYNVGSTSYTGDFNPSVVYGAVSGDELVTPFSFSADVFKVLEQKGLVIQGHGVRLKKVALVVPSGIQSVSVTRPVSTRIYSLDGKRLAQPVAGQIFIQNGKKSVKK